MPPKPFTSDDVTFCYENKLACRHVSGEAAYHEHLRESVMGDAYAIGAAHILTYTSEQRASDYAFEQAQNQRLEEAFSRKGPSDRVSVKNGGEPLLASYRAEIRRMIADALRHDDFIGSPPEDCHLIIYKDIPGSMSPYDLDRYPFGKTGRSMLNPDSICGGVFLDEHERETLRNDRDAVVSRLTEKLLSQLHSLRERDDLKQKRGPIEI